ncbi:MAG TPA: M20/M25/M40 family metallo-hydrolase, partial [Longimicrobiales bacterium]|nr:M20/M25/M40 family metallo-hydrolase [Longimicrobiales bacterium]
MSADLSFQRAIEFARDLIRIPSPPGGEGDVAERVAGELERLRFDDVWTDAVGNVLGRVKGRGEASPVMLSCHLDVVDPGDPLGWEHLPYSGDLEGGFLHGRGAMDIKGPLALQTYAAAHFVAERPAGDVLVGHTVLEERGGLGMAHLMEAGEVKPGAVLIGESTAGDVCIGHRGRAEIEVEIRGLAGHASAPERARSALDPLGDVLAALRGLNGTLESDPVLGRSSLVATDVSATPASRNVIPDRAVVVVDWRVLPALSAEDAVERVRGALAERVELPEGLTLEVRFATERQRTWTGQEHERRLFTPGFLLPPEHPVPQAAARVLRQHTGVAPSIRPWTFATDGGHTCGVHGIPTIGLAPGEERYAHTNRERLELRSAEAL